MMPGFNFPHIDISNNKAESGYVQTRPDFAKTLKETGLGMESACSRGLQVQPDPQTN